MSPTSRGELGSVYAVPYVSCMRIGAENLQPDFMFSRPVEEPLGIRHFQMNAPVRFGIGISSMEGTAGAAGEEECVGHGRGLAGLVLIKLLWCIGQDSGSDFQRLLSPNQSESSSGA